MVHAVIGKDSSGGGGGGGGVPPPSATVSFNPSGGTFNATSVNVTITVTGATKLRWKINSGGTYTTVNATSTVVNIALVTSGKTLYADALNASSSVLASRSANYFKQDGGQ